MYTRRIHDSRGTLPSRRLAEQAIRQQPKNPNAWITRQRITVLGTKTVKALRDLYTEAGWLGTASARAQLSVRKAPRTPKPDWGNWTPGNPAAAARALGDALDGSGLSDLLDEAGISVSSINETRLGELGRVISNALDNGWGVDETAAALGDVLDDPSWAETIAWTEMRRATTAASLDTYTANSVEKVEWSTADGNACPICTDNADQGPVPITEGFTSGDDGPPAHPNCGCVIIPVIDFANSADFEEDIVLHAKAAMPTADDQSAALQMLALMPDDPNKPGHLFSPWPVRDDVNADSYVRADLWTACKQKQVHIDNLCASTHHLSRENLRWHIEHVGDVRPDKDDNGDVLAGAGPQVVKTQGDRVIVQGHHRLAAAWLMGIRDALVWQIKEN